MFEPKCQMQSIPLESSGASANLQAISRKSYTSTATFNEVATTLSSPAPVTILILLTNVASEDSKSQAVQQENST